MDLATIAIAIYGAALSTVVFVRDTLAGRARARVYGGYGSAPAPYEGFAFVATIANTGRDSLFIESAGIESWAGARLTSMHGLNGVHLPQELRPGQNLTFVMNLESVHGVALPDPLQLFRSIFVDQVGRVYRGPYCAIGTVKKTDTGWELTTADVPPGVVRLGHRLRGHRRYVPPDPVPPSQ